MTCDAQHSSAAVVSLRYRLVAEAALAAKQDAAIRALAGDRVDRSARDALVRPPIAGGAAPSY